MPTRAPSRPDVTRRGMSRTDGAISVWTSATSGRRPSSVTVTQVPGTGSLRWDRNRPLGSGSPISPYSPRSKQPHLVGGAVAVLHRADHTQLGVPVSLEMQHDVDHVLEGARAGDGAVLGHVADQDRRERALLRVPHQRGGHLTDLGDATRHAVHPWGRDGLHRIDDEQVRPDGLDMAEHRGQIRLRGQEEVLADRSDTVGPQPHLRGRFFSGDVEDGPRACDQRGRLQKQRRLAHARLAGQQQDGARTRPPPSTRSSSSSPVGRALAAFASTAPIGTAGVLTGPGPTARTPARTSREAPASSIVPQAWHSPQRPIHFGACQPHSVQRKALPAGDLAMASTLITGTDIPGPRRRRRQRGSPAAGVE